MNQKEQLRYTIFDRELLSFDNKILPLVGIADAATRDVFIKQIIDSIRRIEYIYTLKKRQISLECGDPSSDLFDPIKAAILKLKEDDIDEAFWLTFLAINYGKNLKHGWLLSREIYGGLGNSNIWTWDLVSADPQAFSSWISDNYKKIKGAFGNHRKYESLRPDAQRSPAGVITSYVDWIGANRSHIEFVKYFDDECESNARLMFSTMYKSMDCVLSFGRTAKFDFLTMVAKLGLAAIEPDSTYMHGATGPVSGINLLFTGKKSSKKTIAQLESYSIQLEENMSLGSMGMQVLEDALCNWQKKPNVYTLFKG